MESKTFGKVKDEAFAGMMIAAITDPIGTAYLVTPDLLEILTQVGSQDRESEIPPHEPNLGLAASGFH